MPITASLYTFIVMLLQVAEATARLPWNSTVFEGHRWNITCNVKVNAAVSKEDLHLTWYLNNKEIIDTGSRITLKYPEQAFGAIWWSELTFDPVRHYDSGKQITITIYTKT